MARPIEGTIPEKEDILNSVIDRTNGKLQSVQIHIKDLYTKLNPILVDDFPNSTTTGEAKALQESPKSRVHQRLRDVNFTIDELDEMLLHLIERIDL